MNILTFAGEKNPQQTKQKQRGGGGIIMWMQFRIKGRGRAGASLATKYTTTQEHQVLYVCNL